MSKCFDCANGNEENGFCKYDAEVSKVCRALAHRRFVPREYTGTVYDWGRLEGVAEDMELDDNEAMVYDCCVYLDDHNVPLTWDNILENITACHGYEITVEEYDDALDTLIELEVLCVLE